MRSNNKSDGAATHNNNNPDEEKFQIRYLDLARLIDANDIKRFQQLAVTVDLNALQQENKPFLFQAIEKNDAQLVKFLLGEEIDYNTDYNVLVKENDKDKGSMQLLKPLDYAKYMKQDEIVALIRKKMSEPSLQERWLKKLETIDVARIENFKSKVKDPVVLKELLEIGLIKASELGSVRLIDYFVVNYNVNINCTARVNNILVTPLLHSIANNKIEAAKYLIFRNADIHLKGEYGDALVTAVHFETSNDLITVILEKGANLASRHRDWPDLNLREYCVQLNKVKPKLAIDNFVFKLIANGEYNKLKNFADGGYLNINVTNRFRKTSRDVAKERNHLNIVQLIDEIEESQRRLRTKMNY